MNCSGCNRPHYPGEPYKVCNQFTFHHDCFRCIRCQMQINGNRYKSSDSGPMCLSCGLPNCFRCRTPIEGETIVAEDSFNRPYAFHPGCFCCAMCNVPIGSSYKSTEDETFFCLNCARSLAQSKLKGAGFQVGGMRGEMMQSTSGNFANPNSNRAAYPTMQMGGSQMGQGGAILPPGFGQQQRDDGNFFQMRASNNGINGTQMTFMQQPQSFAPQSSFLGKKSQQVFDTVMAGSGPQLIQNGMFPIDDGRMFQTPKANPTTGRGGKQGYQKINASPHYHPTLR